MGHPLLGNILKFYLLAWMVIVIVHANILYYQFQFPFWFSASDAFIFNSAYSVFGILYWYIVQYITPEKQGLTSTVVNQSLAVIIGVSFITYFCTSFLTEISEEDTIKLFLNMAVPWRIFLGAFLLGMIVLVYYLIQYSVKFKQQEKDEIALQSLLKNAELEALKFQLNPHFIFNSLNSISSLTLSDSDKAHDMIIKLSDFLRGSLGNDGRQTHTLKDEITQMNLYLDIERIRFGDRLVVSQSIDDDCYEKQVPNLILQPLYENAIKFGIYEHLGKVSINTHCSCQKGILQIVITNNYDTINATKKGSGIGLENVRTRLNLIYGESDLVTIVKEKDLFTVKLQIPQK